MKILFDHQVFAAQQWGGVSRYFSHLALELARKNDVMIHAPLYVSGHLHPDRYRIFGRKVRPFKGVTLLGNTLGMLTPAVGNFDIHHATWYGATTPCRTGKFVHTVHDMIAEMYPEDVRGAARQARLKANSIRQAELILCVSENTRLDLQRMHGVSDERVRVTPLATAMHQLLAEPFNVGCAYILYVGNRGGYKNFQSLLGAFTSSSTLMASHALVCFGGSPFNKLEQATVASLPNSGPGSIIHVGGNDRLLAGAYRAASLFVCPSRYEGFGLPILEAMAMGCPVVAFRAGSIPEVAGDAAHYADEMTVDALRETMEFALNNSCMRKEKVEAGLARAKRFSWEETARLTLEAYMS